MRSAELHHVDFFSLDVEGAELETLETLDFKNHPTFVVLVEISYEGRYQI